MDHWITAYSPESDEITLLDANSLLLINNKLCMNMHFTLDKGLLP